MKITDIEMLNEAKQEKTIPGTNCGNCMWRSEEETKVDAKELDPNGGLKISSKADLELAADADLVTLPGKKKSTEKFYCKNKRVKQFVTDRMCCIYWDADGVYRAYGKTRLY